MIPAISRSRVDLPEPLRPTRPTASPGSIATDTSRSAQTSDASRAPAQHEELLQRPRLPGVDAEAARDAVGADLAGVHAADGTASGPPDEPGEHAHERGIGVRHLDPAQPEPELAAPAPRRLVSMSQRISRWSETKPTGQRRTSLHPAPGQLVEMVEDVRAEPRLARRGVALERERPVVDARLLRDEPARLEQLVAIRVALGEDARSGSECAVKTTWRRPGARSPHTLRQQLDEAGLGAPALHERELGPAGERLLELAPVRRRSTWPSSAARARARREPAPLATARLHRVGDPRRPVAHAGEDGRAELSLERARASPR